MAKLVFDLDSVSCHLAMGYVCCSNPTEQLSVQSLFLASDGMFVHTTRPAWDGDCDCDCNETEIVSFGSGDYLLAMAKHSHRDGTIGNKKSVCIANSSSCFFSFVAALWGVR